MERCFYFSWVGSEYGVLCLKWSPPGWPHGLPPRLDFTQVGFSSNVTSQTILLIYFVLKGPPDHTSLTLLFPHCTSLRPILFICILSVPALFSTVPPASSVCLEHRSCSVSICCTNKWWNQNAFFQYPHQVLDTCIIFAYLICGKQHLCNLHLMSDTDYPVFSLAFVFCFFQKASFSYPLFSYLFPIALQALLIY